MQYEPAQVMASQRILVTGGVQHCPHRVTGFMRSDGSGMQLRTLPEPNACACA